MARPLRPYPPAPRASGNKFLSRIFLSLKKRSFFLVTPLSGRPGHKKTVIFLAVSLSSLSGFLGLRCGRSRSRSQIVLVLRVILLILFDVVIRTEIIHNILCIDAKTFYCHKNVVKIKALYNFE